MTIVTALRSLLFAIAAAMLALLIGRHKRKGEVPYWLRRASSSTALWRIVALAGVLVAAAILVLR